MELNRTENGYGSVDYPAVEHDSFLRHTNKKKNTSTSSSLSKMVLGATLAIAGVGYCVTLQSSMNAQHATITRLQQQIEALHTVMVGNKDIMSASSSSSHVKKQKKHDELPYKFALEHVTPLKTQDFRGTCWDFATVGVLEQTYRAQGIENGWLQKDEYLPLSEQAYGAEVLRLCSGPAGSPQQIACLIPGNSIWQNSTEGGESSELYYLMNGLKNSIFPHTICPYIPHEGNDTWCADLTEEARKNNPLKLSVKKLETFYDEIAVKRALTKENHAMAFTTAMPYITHYYPCIGDFKDDPRCNPASPLCTLCPPELAMSTCCIPIRGGENYNMNGEFIAHRGMTIEGGHVMVLVGYNDLYRTKDGFTGGYILKNSWFDGINPPLGPKHARGSHSMRYWMQEISDWEERVMCPNSHSPHNWYQCGNSGEVIHANGVAGSSSRRSRHNTISNSPRVPLPFKRSHAFREGIESCLSAETQLYAKTNLQPLHLRCTNPEYCIQEEDYLYFVRNSTEWGDRMQMMCLFEYNKASQNSSEICLPPMLLESIAYVFTPIEEEILPNDPDTCGFYFFPYEVQRQYVNKFEGFYVNSFDIKWHEQSYLANKDQYPHLDYSLVEKSQRKQNRYEFVGPFPFARVVGGKDDQEQSHNDGHDHYDLDDDKDN